MGDNNDPHKINDAFEAFKNSIFSATSNLDTKLKDIMPQSAPKKFTIEVVEKKGFWGFGRKVRRVQATAYISMNNILCIDFTDKAEMMPYFNDLK